VTACADGRWFAFSASLDLVCILEKKTVPEHLMELSVLDRPVFLRKSWQNLKIMERLLNMNLIQKNKISYFRTRYMTAVSVYEFYFARASGWNEDFPSHHDRR
jgi:hypothetical protein